MSANGTVRRVAGEVKFGDWYLGAGHADAIGWHTASWQSASYFLRTVCNVGLQSIISHAEYALEMSCHDGNVRKHEPAGRTSSKSCTEKRRRHCGDVPSMGLGGGSAGHSMRGIIETPVPVHHFIAEREAASRKMRNFLHLWIMKNYKSAKPSRKRISYC